jgi:diadenylate cyclase
LQSLREMIQVGWDLLGQLQISDFIDIVIVAFAIYKLLMLTRETRASQVLMGFGVILIASQISRWLNLTALVWIFEYIINNIAIVMVVLFQPELRKALEQLGKGGNLIGRAIHNTKEPPTSYDWVVEEIVQAVQNMSRSKTGALIIMQRSPLRDILESGTYLYARVSKAILENIFVPNTPLHDGAAVISGDTILAAGCFLPLTSSNELSKELGTRHRAALGMAEAYDALVIVVSEETGVISIAEKGALDRYVDAGQLRARLNALYAEGSGKPPIARGLARLWRRGHEK